MKTCNSGCSTTHAGTKYCVKITKWILIMPQMHPRCFQGITWMASRNRDTSSILEKSCTVNLINDHALFTTKVRPKVLVLYTQLGGLEQYE